MQYTAALTLHYRGHHWRFQLDRFTFLRSYRQNLVIDFFVKRHRLCVVKNAQKMSLQQIKDKFMIRTSEATSG